MTTTTNRSMSTVMTNAALSSAMANMSVSTITTNQPESTTPEPLSAACNTCIDLVITNTVIGGLPFVVVIALVVSLARCKRRVLDMIAKHFSICLVILGAAGASLNISTFIALLVNCRKIDPENCTIGYGYIGPATFVLLALVAFISITVWLYWHKEVYDQKEKSETELMKVADSFESISKDIGNVDVNLASYKLEEMQKRKTDFDSAVNKAPKGVELDMTKLQKHEQHMSELITSAGEEIEKKKEEIEKKEKEIIKKNLETELTEAADFIENMSKEIRNADVNVSNYKLEEMNKRKTDFDSVLNKVPEGLELDMTKIRKQKQHMDELITITGEEIEKKKEEIEKKEKEIIKKNLETELTKAADFIENMSKEIRNADVIVASYKLEEMNKRKTDFDSVLNKVPEGLELDMTKIRKQKQHMDELITITGEEIEKKKEEIEKKEKEIIKKNLETELTEAADFIENMSKEIRNADVIVASYKLEEMNKRKSDFDSVLNKVPEGLELDMTKIRKQSQHMDELITITGEEIEKKKEEIEKKEKEIIKKNLESEVKLMEKAYTSITEMSGGIKKKVTMYAKVDLEKIQRNKANFDSAYSKWSEIAEEIGKIEKLPSIEQKKEHLPELIANAEKEVQMKIDDYERQIEQLNDVGKKWIEGRKSTIEKLRIFEGELNDLEEICRIAKIVGTSTSTVFTISSLLAALASIPTGGMSLPLSALLGGIAATGGSVTTISSLIKIIKDSNKLKEAQKALDAHQAETKNIETLFQKMVFSEEYKVRYYAKFGKTRAGLAATSTTLNFARGGGGLAMVAGRQMIPKTVAVVGKVAGPVLGVLTLSFDIYNLVKTTADAKADRKSDIAEPIRKCIRQLENELKAMEIYMPELRML